MRKRWPLRRTTIGVTSGIGQKKPQQPPTRTSNGTVQRNVTAGAGTGTGTRPRPQPIAGTPPPDPSEKCADQKMIQQTCTLFGLDLVSIIEHCASLRGKSGEKALFSNNSRKKNSGKGHKRGFFLLREYVWIPCFSRLILRFSRSKLEYFK